MQRVSVRQRDGLVWWRKTTTESSSNDDQNEELTSLITTCTDNGTNASEHRLHLHSDT